MSNQMNNTSLPLDCSADPGLGVVLIVGAVGVARPQAERVHGRGRVAVSEEAAHEAGELLGRVVVAVGAEADAQRWRHRRERTRVRTTSHALTDDRTRWRSASGSALRRSSAWAAAAPSSSPARRRPPWRRGGDGRSIASCW
jgi:hypothetical protein